MPVQMKKWKVLFVVLFFLGACSSKEKSIQISEIRLDGYISELVLTENLQPQFSWGLTSGFNANEQSAYQVVVADNVSELDHGNFWNSGKVLSSKSQHVVYAGAPLEAGKRYFWKVKVWDALGKESTWSKVSSWQMGLLSEPDWGNAKWIGYEDLSASKRLVEGISGYGKESHGKVEDRAIVPLFRKEFELEKKLASATLFISGLGHYEASLNGEKVGDVFLAPGWSHYDKAVLYNSYDVSDQLVHGKNALGVIVGNGFHYNNRERYRKLIIAYGFPRMICKLQLTYADGTLETVVSDESWKTDQSPITYAGIYGGEDYDARLEQEGWNLPDFQAENWKKAQLVTPPAGVLKADSNHPVKVMEQFNPVSVTQVDDSVWVYDFGQNLSGIIQVDLQGKTGDVVRFLPAESLKENGFVSQRGTGSPYYFQYTLKGQDQESYRPRFSYTGFRYLQVEGACPDTKSGALVKIKNIQSLHTRNSTPQVGAFECSNELFNQIDELIQWGIKSNLQSVMTDCPTREKLGWIEQTQLMGTSVHFNFDLYHLYQKLLQDMQDAQTDKGLVPNIVPEYINFEYYDAAFRDSPEWGSASIMLPWFVYKWYGDADLMRKAWPVMRRYMDYLASRSENFILSHGLGDWYDVGPETPGYTQLTPVDLVATATYFQDAQVMAQMAEVLGKQTEKTHFTDLAGQIKTHFNKTFFDPETATYESGSQTSYAMPLSLGLVDEVYQTEVLANFIQQIQRDKKGITAGDVGFHYMVDVLTRFGQSQLLYEMNNRDDVPGYGYQLKQGATSLAESWQALTSKSMNHLMLGHLMEWFYQGLGGIYQEDHSVAYKNLVLKPQTVDGLTYANVKFQSAYGEIVSHWKMEQDAFVYLVEIPVNTTARVILPFQGRVEVTGLQGATSIDGAEEVQKGACELPCYQIQSGKYQFKVYLNN